MSVINRFHHMVGSVIGRYRILEKLCGRAADVEYEFEDTASACRVARRFLREEWHKDDQALLERFRREALAAAGFTIGSLRASRDRRGRFG